MKTRILHTRFWRDEFVSHLTYKEKLTFVYLLTNEWVNLVGIYELPDKYIKTDLDLSQSELEIIKKKLAGKVTFWNGWVKILHHDKYNTNYSGGKNEVARTREMSLIPDSVLNETDRLSIGYRYPSDSTINHKSETIININKGGTRGGKLEDIGGEDIKEIAEKYQTTEAFVISKIDDIKNYCASTGKKYKDYLATLRNWVKKDAMKLKGGGRNGIKFFVAAGAK